jgi:hypothetical protein
MNVPKQLPFGTLPTERSPARRRQARAGRPLPKSLVPQTSNAAERRLRTAQPSLSRQIRDLESEVGVKLLERKARGITLTKAGRVFLDHARLVFHWPSEF